MLHNFEFDYCMVVKFAHFYTFSWSNIRSKRFFILSMSEVRWPVVVKSYAKEKLSHARLLKTKSHPLQGVTQYQVGSAFILSEVFGGEELLQFSLG